MSYAATILADHPAAYLPLSESSGTTAHDVSGNGHDGTLVGGITLGTTGPILGDPSTGMVFDGATGCVPLTEGTGLPRGSSPYTLELWFRRDGSTNTPADNQELISCVDGGTGGTANALSVESSGTDRTLNADWRETPLTTLQTIVDGTWYHVVTSWDGTTRRIYFNGLPVVSDTPGTLHASGLGAVLGAVSAQNDLFFLGALAQVAIYTHALPAARVLLHYHVATAPSHMLPPVTLNLSATETHHQALSAASIPVVLDAIFIDCDWPEQEDLTGE